MSDASAMVKSTAYESPYQQGLHVTPAIRNHRYVNKICANSIQNPIWLEEELAIRLISVQKQFSRMCTTLGELTQRKNCPNNLPGYIVGIFKRIVLRDICMYAA
jgi:hypothetical protein